MTPAELTEAARAALQAGESVTNIVLDRFAPASTPAGLFDILNLDAVAIDGVTVLAGPGEQLTVDPREGDVVISRVRGEKDAGRLGVVGAPELADWSEVSARGRPVRDAGPGRYAEVLRDGGGALGEAARVTDGAGRVPLDGMVLRPEVDFSRPTFEVGAASEAAPAGDNVAVAAVTHAEAEVWEGERWPGLVHDPEGFDLVETGPIAPGRLVVDEVPLLASHRGTHPDLVLRWNAMPGDVATVDLVVHFHGYSGRGRAMRIDVDKEPKSGLDFSNPSDPSDTRRGRIAPTLCMLPRGNYFGGRSGAGYNLPALATETGLRDLIAFSLDRFTEATGVRVSTGRLILTAHSGGGAGMVGALRFNDPHEIHTFDALYGPAERLATWARARLAAEGSGGPPGALRILYIPGAGTEGHSLEAARSLRSVLESGAPAGAAERYRADATTVAHNDIPRRFGWLLLADAATPLTARERRVREGDGVELSGLVAVEDVVATCRPGEGPPGPEPDPAGRGPHPLIGRGSRRPSVGYAQQCLNEWFSRYQGGTIICRDGSASVRSFIEATIVSLRDNGQMPLVVDCRFGSNTALATQAFQACSRVGRDGKIGPITWPLLEAFAPVPPGPGPAPSGAGLAGLEGRYFPPAGTADAAPFSRASTIQPIVDGRDYFGAIRAQIASLIAGDAWYLAGWWVDAGFRFPDGSRLTDLLFDRVVAGVDVRVIVWANRQVLDNPRLAGALGANAYKTPILRNIAMAEALRARTDASGRAVLAGRTLIDWSGNAASSHHMKFTVFSHASTLSAFVGGMDYEPRRVDAPQHRTGMNFWHDAGVRVGGDAATRALETFVTRWTEASTLSAASYDIGGGPKPYSPAPILPLTPPAGSSATVSADTSVQVMRSFPDSKEFGLLRNTPWATLPSTGVHETKRTFLLALAAAQRYIYIEDQSFDAVDALFPSLVAACQRGVKVIAVLPGEGDPLDAPGKRPAVLSKAVVDGIVAKLSAAQQENLAVWQLDGIIVHSKLVVVDDEYFSIGSANFMDRSMQFTLQGDDSEITVAAVSVGSLARDLRVFLWSEHLRVSDPAAVAEILALSKSLGFWRPGWGSGLTAPHPDTRLVFVGPVPGAGPSPGGGSRAPSSLS